MTRKSAPPLNLRNAIYAILIICAICTYFNFIYPDRGREMLLESPSRTTLVIFESSAIHVTKDMVKKEETKIQFNFTEALEVLNAVGKSGTNLETFLHKAVFHFSKFMKRLENLLENFPNTSSSQSILSRMRANHTEILEKAKNPELHKKGMRGKKENITIAIVSCGARRKEALVMLKSVTLFSQDASLHIVVFGDPETILEVGQDILALKWTVNALGWDFTYELHLVWFPPGTGDVWKKMYTPCATERLFFPSLLPHIDSLIYMDTDILVVSNLTELWLEFKNKMKGDKIAGLAANNEPTARGWYNTMANTPYYGARGLNAGIMLMNLTQMRNFSFEEKSVAAHTLYREKIRLADQDIVNIIFHAFPEKVHQLDCSYNFNWVHCGHAEIYPCHDEITGESSCFCNATMTNGVQIIHGNSKTFHYEELFPFLVRLYAEFEKFNLLTDSPVLLYSKLKAQFASLKKPCHPLTADMLYKNAEKYFQNLHS